MLDKVGGAKGHLTCIYTDIYKYIHKFLHTKILLLFGIFNVDHHWKTCRLEVRVTVTRVEVERRVGGGWKVAFLCVKSEKEGKKNGYIRNEMVKLDHTGG